MKKIALSLLLSLIISSCRPTGGKIPFIPKLKIFKIIIRSPIFKEPLEKSFDFRTLYAQRTIVIDKNLFMNEKFFNAHFSHLQKELSKDEVKVISFFSNTYTNQILERGIPGNFINSEIKNKSQLAEILEDNTHKTIFIFAHNENGRIMNKVTGFEIDIVDLDNLAKQYELNIFTISCNSANYSSSGGAIDAFESDIVAQILTDAINNSQNLHDLLSSIRKKGLFLFITEESFQNFKNDEYGVVVTLSIDENVVRAYIRSSSSEDDDKEESIEAQQRKEAFYKILEMLLNSSGWIFIVSLVFLRMVSDSEFSPSETDAGKFVDITLYSIISISFVITIIRVILGWFE